MSPAVEVTHVSKTFGHVQALRDVSLRVAPGEVFCLLGRNGAGKTTLIKVLSTLWLPDSGHARVFGFDCVKEAVKIRPLISFAGGEGRGFYWRLTGRQNLEFFGTLYNLPASEIRKKIAELAALLEIEDLDKRYDFYSAGQKQRLALALAFLHDPRLIFLDEPTKSLDPLAKQRFQSLVKKLAREHSKTFFMTTHDIQEAETLADRSVVLEQGSLLESGSASLGQVFRKIAEEAACV